MAVNGKKITISTVPVALNAADIDGCLMTIKVTHPIYVDGPDVAIDNGYLVAQSDPPLQLSLAPGEIIYAVRAGEVDATAYILLAMNQ